ncbi:MAG: diaminopimelate epimerase [Gammaproteobacteria bacterium]|nr:MAG: diaminopimelate epimerase [Gammaproteobacteria bacterium]TND05782.1 MAG: diaminopimelate epimerase [Gammaproteobacteria bacterium]
MRLKFTKMHGLGNDFVVLDGVSQPVSLTPEQIRFVADRHFGIGCDQVLMVEKARSPDADFRYRIFNADGSEAEQCGNGARCYARFVAEHGLTDKRMVALETPGGLIYTRIEDDGLVTVNMGFPRFEPAQVPFLADETAPRYTLSVDGQLVTVSVVSIGNPHAVLQVDNVDTAPVDTLGPRIEHHERFPKRVNVGFMQIIDPRRIRLRVFERGVGETLACGSGACAAVVVGHHNALLDETVTVELRGGSLQVSWQGNNDPIWMTGPATSVYEGTIEL